MSISSNYDDIDIVSHRNTTHNDYANAILVKSKSSYEEKKIKYLGYFYANIAFDNHSNFYDYNLLLNLFEKLTYRQLYLLKVFKTKEKYNLHNNRYLRQKMPITLWLILQEIYELYQLNLVKQTDKIGKEEIFLGMGGIIPSNISLSVIGEAIYLYFNVDRLSEEDLQEVIETIQ